MGFEAGLVIGGLILLGVVGVIVGGVLWSAGVAVAAYPKGVSLRGFGVVVLIAALGVGASMTLSAFEILPQTLVRTVTVEALVLVGASFMAWLFTKET